MNQIRRFLYDADGVTSVEYAVMLAMILAVIIGSIGAVGSQTGSLWSTIQAGVVNAFGS